MVANMPIKAISNTYVSEGNRAGQHLAEAASVWCATWAHGILTLLVALGRRPRSSLPQWRRANANLEAAARRDFAPLWSEPDQADQRQEDQHGGRRDR